MSYKVPFVNARQHYANLKTEIDAAIIGCLTTGDLVYRHQLRTFEKNLSAFVGAKYAVGLNSGYHALAFALLGCGIGAGDEVITVGHTFVATVSAIVHAGASPVLVDVDDDYNMDVAAFEAAITPRTRAVMPVHLNGRMADMPGIMDVAERHGLAVIEDAAQALGAQINGRRAGAWGRAGCFSFYPFKILGGFGDGGAIVTDDAEVARMASLLRYNGEDRETGEYHYHGQTALLDNVQAAVLDVKLRHLPSWIDHRRTIAAAYDEGLSHCADVAVTVRDGGGRFDVYQNYVISRPQRDALRAHLRDSGVETLVHWPKPMWEHPALGLGPQNLPRTARICREAISLPMSAETTFDQVAAVTDAIRAFAPATPLTR